jgi:hypothetical protein
LYRRQLDIRKMFAYARDIWEMSMAKRRSNDGRTVGHAIKKETRREVAGEPTTASLDDLIRNLRGRFKSKGSLVEACQRECRRDDRIKSRKLKSWGRV